MILNYNLIDYITKAMEPGLWFHGLLLLLHIAAITHQVTAPVEFHWNSQTFRQLRSEHLKIHT